MTLKFIKFYYYGLDYPISEIARIFNLSRDTVYTYLKGGV